MDKIVELSSKCIQKVGINLVSQQKTGKAKISKLYVKFSPFFLKNLHQIKCFNKRRGLRKVFGKDDLVTHMGSWFSLGYQRTPKQLLVPNQTCDLPALFLLNVEPSTVVTALLYSSASSGLLPFVHFVPFQFSLQGQDAEILQEVRISHF